MSSKITGDQIEACLRRKLKMLAHAHECAIASAMAARREARKQDKAEWDALDDGCKTFLLDYLAGKKDSVQ